MTTFCIIAIDYLIPSVSVRFRAKINQPHAESLIIIIAMAAILESDTLNNPSLDPFKTYY